MFRIQMNSQSQISIKVLRFENEYNNFGQVITHSLKCSCFYLTTSTNR